MQHRTVMTGLIALIAILLLAACGSAETADFAPSPPAVPTDDEVYHYNQLLDRDAIHPVYDPMFIAADQAGLADDQLVLGVAIDGQAKAYPIAVLNGREMVNDELAGIPILATW
jgi:hypothetical protein